MSAVNRERPDHGVDHIAPMSVIRLIILLSMVDSQQSAARFPSAMGLTPWGRTRSFPPARHPNGEGAAGPKLFAAHVERTAASLTRGAPPVISLGGVIMILRPRSIERPAA